MRLFQQTTEVSRFDDVKTFIQEFEIGEQDFIVASESIYRRCFQEHDLKAHVVFKGQYGKSEPTDQMMDALWADFAKTDCKRVIAIGGGAVIDMAKLLVLEDAACAAQVFQREIPLKKVRPLIAVPTTCGSGSEVSSVTISELTSLQTKLGLADPVLFPDAAVLIPELLRELPYDAFVTSAIDALIHGIESYVSPRANRYTEMFSLQAVTMLTEAFVRMQREGEAVRYKLLEEFLMASNMAGIAFGNAGTGMVHAMSYPLSGVYHVNHGEANYQMFTEVFRLYAAKNPMGKLGGMNRTLAGILGCSEERVYEELEAVLQYMLPKKRLQEYGMRPEEAEIFADKVLATQGRLLLQSYVQFTKEEMVGIYRKLL